MKNDVQLVDIKTILRHKSIATTERYIHRLKSVRESIVVFDSILENPQKYWLKHISEQNTLRIIYINREDTTNISKKNQL